MATTVYTAEEVELLDGTVVTLRPLDIKRQRLFVESMRALSKVGEEAASGVEEGEDPDPQTLELLWLDKLVDAAAICLKKELPDTSRDDLEEILDRETIYRIIYVCGGVNLNDTETIAAALEMVKEKEAQESSGTS